ncbi:hypothetical protein SEPCBS119000_004962 [Sporothrix epigloea]|uniref:Uncharacterized protein n=1 Tax=Sporothrix epigloea TaxID=1892477 RepID=A0ABP0DXW0_9PEZI
MLNANPNVLIDRHLRAQQKALPPSSHLNIHICRGHIYFQSIIILLAPGDLAMHSLGKVLVGDILYDMTQSCNLLTAYTFDDIYVGLHNFYNHYPQHFLKSTQGTVTAEQLVDFRCGNPFDSRAGPWSWPQRLPSYLHESCQWTEVPNARIFASVSSPYQAELVVDVQCKRISGSDLLLAGMCGVHHSVFNALDGKKKVARYCSGHIEAKVAGGESSIDCVALPVGGVNDKVKRQMGKSFVYIVRLVSRSATMGKPCGGYLVMRTGGWVVPPMEERLRLYERDYSPLQTSVTCSTAASTVDSVSLPKPGLSRAVQCPLLSLYCNYQPANLCQGQTPEVWTRLADPAVEDVLWMASKLITGTLYKGFRKGAGTGLASQLPMNRVFLRLWEERIRYSSPSSSALARSDLLYQAHLAGHTRLD